MNVIKKAALALLYFSTAAAHAEEFLELPPRYAVEVVVFQHLDQSHSTLETPPPPDPYALESPAPPRQATGPQVEFLLLDPSTGMTAFTQLGPERQTLGGAWRRLERLDAYRPLAYLSWSQPALGRAAAPSFWLADVGATPPGLQGQVKLYKERFVHLALDLTWQEAAGAQPARPAARIEESRRLRGDLVQYFDNPRFGAIAYVRELEMPEASPDPVTEPAG